ncbi:MAG TPA: LOG family protein, partial [Actinomycetota bacterium]|nr:LOG family protein [Actinomycetota bacterium]
ARARDLFARLPLILDADAWVALPGGAGTLAEVALCWNVLQYDRPVGRPLVLVGDRWRHSFDALREHLVVVDPADHDLVGRVETPAEALGLVMEAMAQAKNSSTA